MRELILKDYTHENALRTGVDLDKLDDIDYIEISVVTGDEIAEVRYKNGMKEKFDSSNDRMMNFYDGEYTLCSSKLGINLIDKFVKRKGTYDFWDWDEEEL